MRISDWSSDVCSSDLAACAADKDVVCARPAVIWQQFTRKRAKTALHPVSDHSAANFLRNGDAKPLDRLPVSPVMNQKDETGHCHAATLVSGKKIRALANCDEHQIGRAHVRNQAKNANPVCRLTLDKTKQ